MSINYFLYGLTAFSMGLVVLLRGSRRSQLALGHNFYWLGAFGFVTSAYAWGRMFANLATGDTANGILLSIILGTSGIVLIRFGIGLIVTAGPLPSWLQFLPMIILVPAAFVTAYATVVMTTTADYFAAADQWIRYLLLFPGNVLAAMGFFLQWKRLKQSRSILAAAGAAFLLNAFFMGAVTHSSGFSDSAIEQITHLPVDLWRIGSLVLVALLVAESMNIFGIERQQEILRLQRAREAAENAALTIRAQSQKESEAWLNALVNISQQIAAMDDTDAILAVIVRLARELIHGDTATLALNDGTLHYKCQASASGVQMLRGERVVSRVVDSAAESGCAQCYPESGSAAVVTWQIGQQEYRAQVAVVVPLQLSQKSIGVLWVGRYENQPLCPRDVVNLAHLANQIVIALEHASMAARLQSLAVLEERSRIAREMHDSLAQILGYLGLEMQTLEALTRQHDEATVLAQLAEARALIKSAQADVRENILSLRTTLAEGAGFVTALKQYVEEFGLQAGIATQVKADEVFDLSPLAQTQAVRIVQEALTNVRKHARAGHVCVCLKAAGDCLTITICDDGIGIPNHNERNGHFGLQTMRERAESIGGSLRITSSPGLGTTIHVQLPFA